MNIIETASIIVTIFCLASTIACFIYTFIISNKTHKKFKDIVKDYEHKIAEFKNKLFKADEDNDPKINDWYTISACIDVENKKTSNKWEEYNKISELILAICSSLQQKPNINDIFFKYKTFDDALKSETFDIYLCKENEKSEKVGKCILRIKPEIVVKSNETKNIDK